MAGSVNRVRRPVAIPKAAKSKKTLKTSSLKLVTNPLRIMTIRENKLVAPTEKKNDEQQPLYIKKPKRTEHPHTSKPEHVVEIDHLFFLKSTMVGVRRRRRRVKSNSIIK